jgi:hypothetical protein
MGYPFHKRTLKDGLRHVLTIALGLLGCGCVDHPVSPPAQPGAGIVKNAPGRTPHPPADRAAFEYAVSGGMPRGAVLLWVCVDTQTMRMVVSNTTICAFPVSTSRFGTGNREHSNQTPPGLHEVVDRFGADEPPGRVFKSRRATARVIPAANWHGASSEDVVLTRILHLCGREPGINQGPGIDSWQRCIYIHGTNEEHLLGSPASHGCIRMANTAIVDLFHAVRARPVWCLVTPAAKATPHG